MRSMDVPTAGCDLKNPVNLYIVNVVGIALSAALWGAGCMQTSMYFMNYESDRLLLKGMVLTVWLLETAIEVLCLAGIFPLAANPLSVVTISLPRAMIMRTLLSHVLATAVQLFFLHRIYRFAGGSLAARVLLALATLIATWQIVGAAVWTNWAVSDSVVVALLWKTPRVEAVFVSLRAVSAFVDVFIAVWMTTLLLYSKRHMSFQSIDRLIFRLVVMTVNTGLWTAVLAVINFSLLAWRPDSFVWSIFEYPLGALYLNTLLANLNARRYMRGFVHLDDDASGVGGAPVARISCATRSAPSY